VPTIHGEEELIDFRREWTGARMLALVREHGGRLRVNWPIGVGKSHNIDAVIEAATREGNYDLVIALFPTRQLLQERRWVREPPLGVRVVSLQPRPRKRCGPDRDTEWRHFEQAGPGMLGRERICAPCPLRRDCPWPEQYGKRLRNAQVIYGTHAHLERSPNFITQLVHWAKASRALLLLDEVSFLMTSFRRRVSRDELTRFVDVLKGMTPEKQDRQHEAWLYRSELLLRAGTDDLRHTDWWMPPVHPGWALAVQHCGWQVYGKAFTFLGYALRQFGQSPLGSRERDARGNISFAALPSLGCDFVLYSGTAHPELTQFRLGADFASPFDGYRFQHPGTTWYNIASRLGTLTYFPGNADQILDFFAGLVACRLREGRRPLLVAKKRFLRFCAKAMTDRLRALGIKGARIVTGRWRAADLARPHAVPLIGYGEVGTNLFEGFDCAYCLTGYYVTEHVVNAILQDVLASDGHLPIQITTEGHPRRRVAGVVHPGHRVYDVHHLAQLALGQQEMDVVLQAVGRVRPYTRPREVITFQCADHPQLAYTREFQTLGEARQFFEVPHRRAREQQENIARIQSMKARGFTQSDIARELGVSIRTVKRYWK